MNYQTNTTLFGLPLVHIAIGKAEDGRYKRGIAKGWIAIGDISYGVVLSLGGLAFGGIAIGGLALGLLSFAGLAIGVVALGGGAIGFMAVGGGAVAWRAAFGGFAMANQYAQGGAAVAEHANDLVARDYFDNSGLFSMAKVVVDHSRWFLLLTLLPMVQGVVRRWKQRDSG